MRNRRSQVALTAVALLLGFLVVVQLQAQQAGTGLETQSAQDLTLLVANLTARNDQLRGEAADLQRQLDAITASRARGETALGQVRGDLERVRMWAGIDPATGPGVRIVVYGGVPAVAVTDLVNELRNAGAEAVAIEGVRVTAATVVAGPVGALSVENTALGPRIEIQAIGNPQALTGALTRVGGLAAQLQASYEDVRVEVTPLDAVDVAASERALLPTYGSPRP
jgi:uncharacterized protein YlxW (UPF0749 family)